MSKRKNKDRSKRGSTLPETSNLAAEHATYEPNERAEAGAYLIAGVTLISESIHTEYTDELSPEGQEWLNRHRETLESLIATPESLFAMSIFSDINERQGVLAVEGAILAAKLVRLVNLGVCNREYTTYALTNIAAAFTPEAVK